MLLSPRAQQSYKGFEGFQEKELFGTGGFGRVYKGTLSK